MHILLVALVAWLCAACALPPAAPARITVEVTASYRERMALPAGAVFEATVIDTARADIAATPLASARVPAGAGGPLRASLSLATDAAKPPARLAVRGRVLVGDQLLFTTDTAVMLQAGPPVQQVALLLRRASGGAATGLQRMDGRYSLWADAAWFVDCASGQRLWVVPEGANAELESAALQARRQVGDAVLASVEGRIVQRANMEGPVRPALIVGRLVGVSPEPTCPAGTSASLENTYWKLVELRGAAVPVTPGRPEPHLILQSAQRRVAGSSGCNRMMGSYELEGERLRFGRMAGTLMACPSGADVERAFLDALPAVQGWRVNGQELELKDAGGAVIARFESRLL